MAGSGVPMWGSQQVITWDPPSPLQSPRTGPWLLWRLLEVHLGCRGREEMFIPISPLKPQAFIRAGSSSSRRPIDFPATSGLSPLFETHFLGGVPHAGHLTSTFCTLSLWVLPSALRDRGYPPVLQMRKLGAAWETACPGLTARS